MKRREALKNVALLLGTAISATTMGVLFESCNRPTGSTGQISFSAEDKSLLAEFADIIMPPTAGVGGAKEAGMGNFIPMMMTDCYPEKEQSAFYQGLLEFRQKAIDDYKKDFTAMTLEERNHFLGAIREMLLSKGNEASAPLKSFFILGRDLSLLGYFSSEIGCTQARAYVQVPGRYDGSAQLKPGQKSWAT